MRGNKKAIILDAIVDLIEEDSIKAIAYDAVSEKTKITRDGLLYHFPSREDLVLGVHQHICERWATTMTASGMASPKTADIHDKTLAYIKGASSANRVEMILLLESAMDEAVQELWQSVIDDWAPPFPDPDDNEAMDLFLVRLAVDGLRVSEALANKALKDGVMRRLEQMVKTRNSNNFSTSTT